MLIVALIFLVGVYTVSTDTHTHTHNRSIEHTKKQQVTVETGDTELDGLSQLLL